MIPYLGNYYCISCTEYFSLKSPIILLLIIVWPASEQDNCESWLWSVSRAGDAVVAHTIPM